MKVMVSECHNALPLNKKLNGKLGICGKCNEWTEFYTDFWNEKKLDQYCLEKENRRLRQRRNKNRREN